jgi:hypothetical protein
VSTLIEHKISPLIVPISVTITYLDNEEHRIYFDAMLAIMPLLAFFILGVQPVGSEAT